MTSSEPELVFSPAESARFGLDVARVVLSAEDVADTVRMSRLRHALDTSDARVVIVRYPSSELSLISLVDANGSWDIYPGGSLLYWECSRPVDRPFEETTVVDGTDREARHPELVSLVEEIFTDYRNHYAADPLLPPDAAAAGYREWAGGLIDSSDVLVVTVDVADQPVGIALVSDEGGEWDVRLAGIAPAHQRRGHYGRLIARVEREAARAGVRLIISTQAHNVGVQSAWASFGWRPFDAIETVHLVRRATKTP